MIGAVAQTMDSLIVLAHAMQFGGKSSGEVAVGRKPIQWCVGEVLAVVL
jgi:hypothetical protein